MRKRFSILIILTIAAITAISLTAFAGSGKIVITWYPQEYYQPQAYPQTAKVVEEVVKNYEALHPNVEIKLVQVPSSANYTEWMAAQVAAGTEPDIAWMWGPTTWTQKGWWIPLNKYLEEPDPYAASGAGKEHWKDAIPEYAWTFMENPADGKIYIYPMDSLVTGLIYNKTIFDKLHLPTHWNSWGEFMDTMAAIKTAGYIPFSAYWGSTGGAFTSWADPAVYTPLMAAQLPKIDYMTQLNTSAFYYKGVLLRGPNQEEWSKAVYDGIISAYSPQYTKYLQIMREWSKYFPAGFASLSGFAPVLSLFDSGKVAMIWLGSWRFPDLKNTPFSWGVTYLPGFTKKEIPDLPNPLVGTAFSAGGGVQAGTALYGITEAASKNGVLKESLDFLMYLTTPQGMGKIITTTGTMFPLIKGTQTAPQLDPFVDINALPQVSLGDGPTSNNPKFGAEYTADFMDYLIGSISMQEMQKRAQTIFEEALKYNATTYHYSWYK